MFSPFFPSFTGNEPSGKQKHNVKLQKWKIKQAVTVGSRFNIYVHDSSDKTPKAHIMVDHLRKTEIS